MRYELSEEYIPTGDPTRNDLRNKFIPGKNKNVKPYLQVFTDRSGFMPDLSVLDLLFNLGTRAHEYLGSSDLNL